MDAAIFRQQVENALIHRRWHPAEAQTKIAEYDDALAREERSECLKIAAMYGGKDAEAIAELIGQRSFRKRT